MRILLTGHEGNLGASMRQHFVELGYEVAGWGRQQDILKLDQKTVKEIRPDVVINCATAMNRIGSVYELGGADERVNVLGTRTLVEALRGTDIGLVHISTKDVYGEVYTPEDVREEGAHLVPRFAVNEDQPLRPRTVYAKTKLMGEFIAESHPKTTIVRLSSAYSSLFHYRGNWILNFCRAAREKRVVQINGSGKQLRDPLHADDLADLALLVHEKQVWGQRLNAGGGPERVYSIVEVLDMIDPKLPREFRPGGDLGYVTDIGLATKLLGWKPGRSLPVELKKLIEAVNRE